MRKEKVAKQIFSVVLGISGLILIGVFGHWLIALGAFLMLWGNNIEQRASR